MKSDDVEQATFERELTMMAADYEILNELKKIYQNISIILFSNSFNVSMSF